MRPLDQSADQEHTDEDSYFYTGRTFRVRETRASDIPVWYKWFNDPEITREMIHGIVPNTMESQEQYRLAHIDGSRKIMFSLLARDAPTLIGTCSINVTGPWSHGHAEISVVIGNKAYHRGPIYLEVTTWQLDHAFLMMNMHSVFAGTSVENKVVLETLERVGFSKVGEWRECRYRNGRYHNAAIFDILRDEWMAKRGCR